MVLGVIGTIWCMSRSCICKCLYTTTSPNTGTIIYMVGFPTIVGVALVYVHMNGLSTNQDMLEAWGWLVEI